MAVANSEEILRRVQRTIAEQLGLSILDVTVEKHVNDDLGADSLDDVEITMALEDEFDIEIRDEDADRCRTVQAIAEYLATRQVESIN